MIIVYIFRYQEEGESEELFKVTLIHKFQYTEVKKSLKMGILRFALIIAKLFIGNSNKIDRREVVTDP